jgi:predicted RNA-binding protein with PUA domain
VLEELLAAFRAAHPRIRRIFCETLPPGVLAEQIRRGGLRMEELIVTTPPDVFTAGREEMEALRREGFVRDYRSYACNGLAILVPAANPAGVRGLDDLGRPGSAW